VLKPDLLEDLYAVALSLLKKKGRRWPVVK
jgi:hypothetical protein